MPDHRLTPTTSGGFQFEYFLKDHLGDIMVTFTDANNDGTPEILTKDHYYPFGLTMPDLSYQAAGTTNLLKYNGKEIQTDHDLNVYDYGARMYDPVIGRWGTSDPLAEQYRRWSPYNYCMNNPMRFIDPDGMGVIDYFNLAGNRIGTDGNPLDTRSFVVKDKEEAKRVEETDKQGGTTDLTTLKSAELSPDKASLETALSDFFETEKAGGGRERTSFTFKDGTSVHGALGPEAYVTGSNRKNAYIHSESNTPSIPKGYSVNDIISISHSHITKVLNFQGLQFSGDATVPSDIDKNGVFKMTNLNIITGPLGKGFRTFDEFIPANNGIAVYRGGNLTYEMTIDAVMRMIKTMP